MTIQRSIGRRLSRCAAHVLWDSALWLSALAAATGQQPAFPGAEGFGAFASGGRSGTVYHVTNLSDSGSGSFRDAVSAANRTIVFDVSGTINLGSAISITKSNITVAGQTAPGDGIAFKGNLVGVKARNVIVRYIRCRPGDVNCPSFQEDAFHFDTAFDSIADHVTATWSIDECLSTTHSTNVTVQWCLIAEPLNDSCHVKGIHGYGSLIRYGNGGISYHHNLYAHCRSRNPRSPSDNLRVDFVNNVVYNWGILAGYNEDDTADSGSGFVNYANYVGNYLIAGANTTQNPPRVFRSGVPAAFHTQIYQSGNFVDGNKNDVLDGTDNGWSVFGAPFTTNTTRLPFPQVSTDTANAGFVRVLSTAGASLARDAVDSGVVSNVINQDGMIIDSQTQVGGWPTLNSLPTPMDTDQDGMPDFWETALGSDINNAADRNDLMTDGYTRLEWYLNWLAGPHARVTNSFVDVELRQYADGLTSPSFSVSSPSNGTVTVLGDGHTAQFTPTTNFSGLASFQFVATGSPANLTGTVSVLVSASAAPPLAPFEQWQIDYFGSTNNPAAAAADPDGDGMSNTNEFLTGTVPTNSASALRITSVAAQGSNIGVAWQTAGGHTNAVQATTNDSYTTNFADISSPIVISGNGDVTTNYTDDGGATNIPSRFYRIRLVP
jgi:Bacterial Ig domain